MKAMLDNKGAARYNESSEWERYSRTDKEAKKCSDFAVNNIKGESFCPSPPHYRLMTTDHSIPYSADLIRLLSSLKYSPSSAFPKTTKLTVSTYSRLSSYSHADQWYSLFPYLWTAGFPPIPCITDKQTARKYASAIV